MQSSCIRVVVAILDYVINGRMIMVAKTVKNPQKAGVLYQKHLHSFMAPVIGKSIASSNFVFKPSSQIRQEFEVLTKLMSLFTSEESLFVLSDEAFYSAE